MINVTIIEMRYFFLLLILFFSLPQNTRSEDALNEFLIAKPYMKDTRFRETVIMMLYDNQEGAAGLVINKPIETISLSKLFAGINLTLPEETINKNITLYWGGPVKSDSIFFIHSSDYKSQDVILSNQNFTVTRAPDILFDLAIDKGPKNYLILTGIAVWQPGQLDFEMERGDWEKKLNSYIPLFDNGNEMWSSIIGSRDI